jgi:hypothetical protein
VTGDQVDDHSTVFDRRNADREVLDAVAGDVANLQHAG